MPCRNQKDVQTVVGEGNGKESGISNENVEGKDSDDRVRSSLTELDKNMNSKKDNQAEKDIGDINGNAVSDEARLQKDVQGESGEAPRRRGCLCCSGAADVKTENSLSPVSEEINVSKVDSSNAAEIDSEIENGEKEEEESECESVSITKSKDGKGSVNPKKKKGKRKPLQNVSENPAYYVDDESKGKATMALSFPSKKGKYSLAENEDDDNVSRTRRPMPVKAPRKSSGGEKSMENQQQHQHQLSSGENEEESKPRQKKKKGKKKKIVEDSDEVMEMRSIYENQIASIQQSPTAHGPVLSTVDLVVTGPPTVEMEEDLLENAEEERRKNKQRVREKRFKEKDPHASPAKAGHHQGDGSVGAVYETAQKEIDKVLGPRNEEKQRKKERKSKEKKRKDKSDDETVSISVPEGGDSPAPDSLEDARLKIHRLLDDAFSLISQSRSSIGNKVHPTSQQSSVDKESPRSSRHSRHSHSSLEGDGKHTQPTQQQPATTEEKRHTPLFVQRSHGDYDRSGLISWSPYRASDDTALISLPNTQINLTSVAPQRDPITSTTVFSESLPSSLQPNYYTTLPGEPIVLTTSSPKPSTPPSPSSNHATDRHKPPHPNEEFLTPYYGLNSYHELPPPSSVIPNHHHHYDTSRTNGGGVRGGDSSNDDYRSSTDEDYHHHHHHRPPLAHSGPGTHGQNEGRDVVDVIKRSVQPGENPQPLIHSLREELMQLSRRHTAPTGGDQGAGHTSNSRGKSSSSQSMRDSHTRRDSKPATYEDDGNRYRNMRNGHLKTDL